MASRASEPGRSPVKLERWEQRDLPLLSRLVGDPDMMAHLGGPDSAERIAARLQRYQSDPNQFRIVERAAGQSVGWVGFWERDWNGPTWEIGWSVIPEAQGRGLAAAATTEALERAAAAGQHRLVHAFPSVRNIPSNAVCRKTGFVLIGPCDFEYPPGRLMRCNEWRYDLEG